VNRRDLTISLGILALSVVFFFWNPLVVRHLESTVLDWHFQLRGELLPEQRPVTLVLIDDASLNLLGRWLIYGLQAPFDTMITLPTVPAAAVNPLTTGISGTARMDEYVLDPAAGVSASSSDLWYLPRMLNERARSAASLYTP